MQVATTGIAFCQFDNQVANGDYVVVSSNNIGFCASVGTTYPTPGTTGQLLGIALATIGLDDFGYIAPIPVLLNGAGGVQ